MKINKLIAGCLMGACMVACTSNDDELKNGKETGLLELSVSVNSKVNNVTNNASRVVTANDFPVEIVTEDGEEAITFRSVTEMGTDPITLSVGKYIIKAHTPGEIQPQMSEPYYYGEESFTISKGITTNANVECKMKNTKIQLSYGPEFDVQFKAWTITITDGTSNILAYTDNNGKQPTEVAPVYWLIADGVAALRVEVQATTAAGDKIRDSRLIYRKEGSTSDFWAGNDALTITMSPAPDTEDPSGIQGGGIDISIDAVFDETGEVVEIPVVPGGGTSTPEPPVVDPDDPDTPTGDGPSLSGEYLTPQGLTYSKSSGEDFPEVSVHMEVTAGIESVKVALVTDNDEFGGLAAGLGLTSDGVDLVGNEEFNFIDLPEKGGTEYDFVLGTLSDALVEFTGKHQFIVTVTDQNGDSATAKLIITIEE